MNAKEFKSFINDIRKHDVTVKQGWFDNSFVNDLTMEHITRRRNADGTETFSRWNIPFDKQDGHKYVMPKFTGEVKCLLNQALSFKQSCNILLTGQMGTGKTEFVYEIAKEMGFKVFHVNGSESITSMDFLGSMGVKVDEKTNQNYTYFEKGSLYRAFIEGTEVDENGDQILYDENGNVSPNGNPKVIGNPALFFLDEFATLLPEVFLGVFNRPMEIPRQMGASRTMEINGKIIKSHPAFVMFLSGNTVGTGNNGKYQMSYTAQTNKMDESTLNRISATYQFGYNKTAEKWLATGILNDDYEVDNVMQLRDKMRQMFKDEKVERVFSTRTLVQICHAAEAFKEMYGERAVPMAIKTTCFNKLTYEDRQAWNETVRAIWGIDFDAEMANESKDYDYI